MRALHDADPHSWSARTKQFLTGDDSDALSHLAEVINDFSVGVSQHLPLADPKFLEPQKPIEAVPNS